MMSCEHEKRGGESFGCVDNLRMQIKDAGGHSSEPPRIGVGERLSRAVTEMMAAQGEILDLSKEAETALTKEKLKSEKLQKMVDEQNDSILELRAVGKKAEEKAANMEEEVAVLKRRLDETRSEADRVLEAQVENALLKVELHKWRSKAAAAEAAEERSKSEKFALNRALQLAGAPQEGKTTQRNNNISSVTISRKEYAELLNKAEEEVMKEQKLGILERELMGATHKMRVLRTRAEQAISRAEAAEKGKAEAEDKLKRRKEKEKEKKEFFKNLREQMNSREAAASPDFALKNTPAIQTLSNILEIPL